MGTTGTPLDGRYRLGDLLGTGGMADVYRAVDLRLSRPVAVKLFHPKADGATIARLETEARLLAGLSHPGLVRLYDIGADDSRPYLVMQLVDGSTLRGHLDRGVLPADSVARFGMRLADTLAYVHSRDIVHRDLKPSNILIDHDGTCFLADFGIARAMGTERLTSAGHCVGTAAYLAPEQVRGAETGPAGDVYSLGLVLLECLTGEPEFTGSDIEAAIARLSRSPRIPKWLPRVWADTLAAMTLREPADRPDMAEVARRLAHCALRGPLARRPAVAPTRQVPAPRATTVRIPLVAADKRPTTVLRAALFTGALLFGGLAAVTATLPGAPRQQARSQEAPVAVAPVPFGPSPTTATRTGGATAVVRPPTPARGRGSSTTPASAVQERPRGATKVDHPVEVSGSGRGHD
ncbi:protein kinase [Actinokineospora sp. PR83]|uniref:serine/threonine-protein kinase n=1 Tax=Actinokineospora sp. PR83 TaxID=2884908 RepID=UPI001F330F41|nr:serine/threonine-protein kinase [Actinokineospora sp. PR83]MCG8914344.1 protein kinase [Actinokineospora sp. PR83]